MYKPINNPPFLVNDDDGTNSPLEHQRTISKLTTALGVLFYREKAIALEPLPETPLGEGPGHQVPDVILFDNEVELTRVIIEVTQTRTANRDLQKIIHLIENDNYGIEEGFVYNYKTRQWIRYRKGDGGAAKATSVSEVLGVDLGVMV